MEEAREVSNVSADSGFYSEETVKAIEKEDEVLLAALSETPMLA